jgi:hypothetical protein
MVTALKAASKMRGHPQQTQPGDSALLRESRERTNPHKEKWPQILQLNPSNRSLLIFTPHRKKTYFVLT